MTSTKKKKELSTKEFIQRAKEIRTHDDLQSLRTHAIETENTYRELFARKREQWEIPEIDDPYVFLVNVFDCYEDVFAKRLERFKEDTSPRCFEHKEDEKDDNDENPNEEGEEKMDEPTIQHNNITDAVAPTLEEFLLSWDCLTEGLLRFLNWDNVFAAGGSVAGCLSPLPPHIASGGPSATRVKRRKYFHDTFLPSSDIDLFLYGLNEEQAEAKLLEIYDAIQAANPYEIRAFRSAHAITLVSRYPFRHVQIVLRLYNSPSEVLMGFDVDACAVGYNGKEVLVCPRTALAILTRTNTVDLSRRSPSYEMRLAKYAQRGYEIAVPSLDRDRVDPFLYEARFDQTKGLARLLMLERLQTPLQRLRYRIEGQLKRTPQNEHWRIQQKLYQAQRDVRNLDRAEGTEGVIGSMTPPSTSAEMSNYSTVFLPWGPDWTAQRTERLMRKKDKILNKIQFTKEGKVVANRRGYKIHICAVGTMAEVMEDPFPKDAPIPKSVPEEALESLVRGRVSWLVDNPGRQQIGSFHPITTEDWTEGAYISKATEALTAAAVANDAKKAQELLDACKTEQEVQKLLSARDFLGRSALHVAALVPSTKVCRVVLQHKAVEEGLLQARLADGRTALHLAAMKGDEETIKLILDKRKELALVKCKKKEKDDDEEEEKDGAGGMEEGEALVEVLDIDAADWEVKLSPLQYAVTLGHVNAVRTLLAYKANARKIAVHKDRNESLSLISLLALYACECCLEHEEKDASSYSVVSTLLEMLLDAGASSGQVDTTNWTCWHRLAAASGYNSTGTTAARASRALETFLTVDAAKQKNNQARALDVIDDQTRTALYVATACGNARSIRALLKAGAQACFSTKEWGARVRQLQEAQARAAEGGGRVRRHVAPFMRRHWGGGGEEQPTEEEMRCPLFLAVRNVDVPCIQAYLDHDASLANSVIQVPVPGQTNQGHFGGSTSAPQTLSKRPLDMLHKTKVRVKGASAGRGKQKQRRHQRLEKIHAKVKACRTRISKIQEEISKLSSSNTYQQCVWSLVLRREQESLASAELQAKLHTMSEKDLADEKEALEQIEEACRIVREAGGVPENDSQEDAGDEAEEDGMLAPVPPHHFIQQAPSDDAAAASTEVSNPFQSFTELQPFNFEAVLVMTAGYQRHYYHQQSHPLLFNKTHALKLMAASAAGDVETIQSVTAVANVAMVDALHYTPFFLCVVGGNVQALQVVFNVAKEQFARYVAKELKRLQKQTEDDEAKKKDKDNKSDEEDAKNMVKDQLRRLNNLDLAAGEGPRDSGPTPDEMRERLEKAEEAALKQSEVVVTSADSDHSKDPPSSRTPPEMLLLHRSIVRSDIDEKDNGVGCCPQVAELKAKLVKAHPNSFENKWKKQPVRLRPIEFAVIKGDLPMVEALLALSLQGTATEEEEEGSVEGGGVERDEKTSDMATEEATPAVLSVPAVPLDDAEEEHEAECFDEPQDPMEDEDDEEDEDFEEEEDEYEAEYMEDDMEDFHDDAAYSPGFSTNQRLSIRETTFSNAQLRYLLVGDGSCNENLGGLTLLQLAIVLDHLDIFLVLAEYAKEHAIPRAAVLAWKEEVDAAFFKDKKFTDKKEEDAEKKRRKKESDMIEGGVCSTAVPSWAPPKNGDRHGYRHSSDMIRLSITPLQLALFSSSNKIASALLKEGGDANDNKVDQALLGWIVDETTKPIDQAASKKPTMPRSSQRGINALDNSMATRMWIQRQLGQSHGSSNDETLMFAELSYRLVQPTAVDGAGRTALFYAPAPLIGKVVQSAVQANDKRNAATLQSQSLEQVRSAFLESLTKTGSVTALMAASSAGEVDRVKALLEVGCRRQRAVGPKRWNPVHLAIPNKLPPRNNARNYHHYSYDMEDEEEEEEEEDAVETESQKWAKARKIIALLLDEAPLSVVKEALLCPEAEHTPLMLAADRKGDEQTIALLLEKTAAAAGNKGLSKRDGELNSVLHLALGAALNSDEKEHGGNSSHDEKTSNEDGLNGVATILQQSTDAVGGPHTENARGLTPLELAIQSISFVWERSSMTQHPALTGSRQHHRRQRRQMLVRGPLPPKPPSTENEKPAKSQPSPMVARSGLALLEKKVKEAELSGCREAVAFEQVQEARKRRAKVLTSTAEATHGNFGSTEESQEQCEPTGPPVVIDERRTSSPSQWDGWP